MNFTENAWEVFNRSIEDYHITDNVDAPEKIHTKKTLWNTFCMLKIGLTPFSGT